MGQRALERFRLLWRIPVYFCGTGVLALAWFIAWPLSALSPVVRRRMRHLTMTGWGRWTLWCFGIRLERRGVLPKRGVLLVANHVSYVDIFVLAASADVVFVSMHELRAWPFFGVMARSIGTVFIDRERKRDIVAVNRDLAAWIGRGYTVVLFPEGAHSHGHSVQPFRPSLFEPAAAAGIDVACATIHFATLAGDLPASRVVPWVREPFLAHAARLLSRRRIDARITFHPELERCADRKELAKRLHARVASAFVPLADV